MAASAAYTTKCRRDPLSCCWMVCRSAGRLNCPVVGRTINCVAVTRNIIISFRIYFCIIIPAPADKSRHQRTTATGTGTGHHSTECWCFHFFHSTTTDFILCGGLWGLTWQITFSRTEESKDVNGVSVIVALGNSCCWWPRGFTCVPQFQAIRRGDVGSFVAPGSHFPNTRHIPHQSSFICVSRQRCPSIYMYMNIRGTRN